jgi:hypothetical protein
MLLEPMNRAVASNKTETSWHVGRGSSPWSLDPNAANFIRRSQRRGTSSPAIIHMPNCKTANTTTTANTFVARKSADRRPPNMNLTGSRDRWDDGATCPLTSPDGATPRWRKSRGNVFRCGAVSSIEAAPQGNTRPTLANYKPMPSTGVPTLSHRQSCW